MKQHLRALVVMTGILTFAVSAMHFSQKAAVLRDVATQSERLPSKFRYEGAKRDAVLKKFRLRAREMSLTIKDQHLAELGKGELDGLLKIFEIGDKVIAG